MKDEPKNWKRPSFVANGGDPFLFYVVLGAVDFSTAFSPRKYRSNGPTEGLAVTAYDRVQHPQVAAGFRSGFLWEEFATANPVVARQVADSNDCCVLRGTPEDSHTLNYLRDTVGLIAYLLDNGGVAVFDPWMFRWWTAAEWQETVFAATRLQLDHHVVILVSKEADPSLKWFHSRGMRKFGRPDISVHNVSTAFEDDVIELCNDLMAFQADGDVLLDGQPVARDSLPPGGTMHYAGDLDDPDFNNIHLEVAWPHGVF